VLAVSVVAGAQEVKFIDLSLVEQRTTLRHPPSRSTCDPGETCVGRGVGGSVADGAPDRRNPHALGVSLDHVSTSNITLDAFDAEFRILNTGLAPIEVPIFPNLSDLQPSDETKPFNYLSLALVVKLEVTGPTQGMGLGYVELYGAANRADTIITLQPGQWVRVKSKMKLRTWPSTSVAAKLRGGFWLRTNVFTPREGGGFTQVTNLYPNPSEFPAIEVQFTPTRSTQAH
jgi:hypothetical protein